MKLIVDSLMENFHFKMYTDDVYEYEETLWHDGPEDYFRRNIETGWSERHRVDGPACIRIYKNGERREWFYIEGRELTKEEFENKPSWVLNKYF